MCKDEIQCDLWILGLRALISLHRHPRPLNNLGSFRQVQSCLNSPAGLFRRRQTLGIVDDGNEFSQVFIPFTFFSFLQLFYCSISSISISEFSFNLVRPC